MTIPHKTSQNGFSLPVLGFGTWGIGGLLRKDASHDKNDIDAIQRAISAGFTHIDTAELYAEGHAEELVGNAIRGINREELFITTKVKDHLKKDEVLKAAEGSLKRLQTDYLDLYLIHAPSPTIPIFETLEAFDELVKQGLVKHIGVSNFTVDQLKEAMSVTKKPIVTNQIHFNYSNVEHQDVLEFCQKVDILFTAYRPVDRGDLTISESKTVDEVCQKYGKTPAQIAINWLISQKNIVALSKMSDPKHVEENLGAIGWEMSEEDIDTLGNISL